MKRFLGSAAILAGLVTAPVLAHHQWADYAWNSDGIAPVSIAVVDNTDARWNGYVNQAVSDWNASQHIDAVIEFGNNSSCAIVTQTIQVCNDNYGDTGWVGLSTIALSSGTITGAAAKLNDHFFETEAYDTYSRRSLTSCHEIGHGYGLGHRNEDFNTDATESCMEYTRLPEGNEHPDAHDYEELSLMYGTPVDDGTGSGGGKGNKGKGGGGGKGGGKKAKMRTALPAIGNSPAAWGRPTGFLPNGKPFRFEKAAGGYTFVTHVTWATEE